MTSVSWRRRAGRAAPPWVEREQVQQHGNANVPGAVVGAWSSAELRSPQVGSGSEAKSTQPRWAVRWSAVSLAPMSGATAAGSPRGDVRRCVRRRPRARRTRITGSCNLRRFPRPGASRANDVASGTNRARQLTGRTENVAMRAYPQRRCFRRCASCGPARIVTGSTDDALATSWSACCVSGAIISWRLFASRGMRRPVSPIRQRSGPCRCHRAANGSNT